MVVINILGAIATLVAGLYRAKKEGDQIVEQRDQWFKLSLSIFGTAFVTFFGMFGAAGLAALKTGDSPLVSLIIAVFAASGSMAAAVLMLWKYSSLTKGIPILAPTLVEQKVLEGGFAYTEPNKTTGGK